MENQELNTQDQDIKTNNEIEKGENDMNQQLENTLETKELGNDETSEAIVQSTEVAEEIDIITVIDDATKNQLPEGVTEKPQNEEQMHMGLIREWPDAVKVYLRVSDDQGEVLCDKVLEMHAKKFCDQYADCRADSEQAGKILEEGKDLATKYTLQVNMVESGLTGTITKYRIRQGIIFNIMKKLVNANKGPTWIEWFKSNFDGREFRSVQDYMRLAKVPNIIRYAVFGKERLLQILRQFSDADKQADDPVGAFIERNGLHFNPNEEVDAQELRIEADIAINHQKLIVAGIPEIPKNMIDTLIRNGMEVESVHVRELKVAKEAGKDVVEIFQTMLAADGKIEPTMTPARKAEGFKKTTDRFLKALESAIADADYRIQVDANLINSLKTMLERLENLVSAAN